MFPPQIMMIMMIKIKGAELKLWRLLICLYYKEHNHLATPNVHIPTYLHAYTVEQFMQSWSIMSICTYML